MIIDLKTAKTYYPKVTQADLDGIEVAIRELTHNNFQNRHIRVIGNVEFNNNTISVKGELLGFVKGKTIEVSNSQYNDGLYVIDEVEDGKITINDSHQFISIVMPQTVITLVEYPADIVSGVTKILKYDSKMGNKMGIKSETISRWQTSYFDQNSSESVNGYPAAIMSFINKYRKLRW